MILLRPVKFLLVICLLLVVESQSTKDQCTKECMNLELFAQCKICAQKCENSEGVQKVSMISCEKNQCMTEGCKSYMTYYLNEKSCLSQCCYSDDQGFQVDTIKKCREKSEQLRGQKIAYQLKIFGAVIAAIIGIPILLFCIISSLHFKYRRLKNTLSSKPCNVQEVKKLDWIKTISKKQSDSQNSAINSVQKKPKAICLICKKENPSCMTQCRHKFHIQCFRYEIFGCNKCSFCNTKQITPSIIICQICNQKYALFDLKSTKQEFQKIVHYQKVYCNTCLQNLFAAAGSQNIPAIQKQKEN